MLVGCVETKQEKSTIVTYPEKIIPTKCERPIFTLVCEEWSTAGKKSISYGTGFLIKYETRFYIVTAAHVIKNTHIIKAEKGVDDFYQVRIRPLYISSNDDITLLSVDGFTHDSDYLELDAKPVEPGDQVITIGCPPRLGYTEKPGIALEYEELPGYDLLATTCKTMPGMSGSPLLKNGRVVGVTTMSRFSKRSMKKKGGYYATSASVLFMLEIRHELLLKQSRKQ